MPAGTSATASDHLLVFADLELEAMCGNGRVDGREQCDDGDANGSSSSCCQSDYTFKADGSASCAGELCARTDTCLAGVWTPGKCATGKACSFCGGECVKTGSGCGCQF